MKLFALPNWFTLGNLLSGCLGILSALQGDLVMTAVFVGIAALMDFLDGLVARISKQSSPVGKDLDSLADMVSFGVLPGFVMFQLIAGREQLMFYHDMRSLANGHLYSYALAAEEYGIFPALMPYAGFVITLFSALRLAKFNNDTRQSESFIGVPTPAVTMFVASLPLLLHHPVMMKDNFFMPEASAANSVDRFLLHPAVLLSLVAVWSFLLVSEIPLFSLKFKKFGWKGNEIRYGFLLFSAVVIALAPRAAFALIIPAYVLVSAVNNLLTKKPGASGEKKS